MQFPFSFWGSNYSPISPTSATCVAWWDPTNNSSITLSSGKASQWNDLSGNGNTLIQTTSTKQFTPTAAAINGKQAMLCNQSLNNMHGSGALSTGQLTSFSMWAVVYGTSLAQYNGIIGSNGVTGNLLLEIGPSANQLDTWIYGVGSVAPTGAATITTNTLYWVAMTYSSGALAVYINNVQKSTSTTASRTLGNNYGVGGDPLNLSNFYGWVGYLGDCAIYNGVLSTTDLTNLYNKFIVPKWG